MNVVVVVALAVVLAVLGGVTVWSIHWDVSAYRWWRAQQVGPQPRWKRRRSNPDSVDREASRWRWIMLALQCALFCFVVGAGGVGAGIYWRMSWMLVSGGNLLFLGLMAWVAYHFVLPKPAGLTSKQLPAWLGRGSRAERRPMR